MKVGNDNNKATGLDKATGSEVIRPRYGRAKQSFPLFWIIGFLGSVLFFVCGFCMIIEFNKATPKDSGMLYFGIFMLLLGFGLLAGVIGTFFTFGISKDKNNLSLVIDIEQALSKAKYSAENLARNVYNGRNNVVIIKTKDGFFRVYGYNGRFITEIRTGSEEDFSTHHLIDPDQRDDSVTVLQNLFSERFPTRKNRIVSNGIVVSAVKKLYETQSLDMVICCLPCIDTTAETKKLIMEDVYITPEVPLVIVSPTSEEGKKKTMREQAAIRELQKTD